MTTHITSARVEETDLYVINTEDGPATRVDYIVTVETADGRRFIHPCRHSQWFYAEQYREMVERAGGIFAELWIPARPAPSLEDELAPGGPEWQREQEDRHS